MTDLTPLEERIAHLTRMVEDLSDVVTRQSREIDLLTRRVTLLIAREQDREATGGGDMGGGGDMVGDAPAASQRPPHW